MANKDFSFVNNYSQTKSIKKSTKCAASGKKKLQGTQQGAPKNTFCLGYTLYFDIW